MHMDMKIRMGISACLLGEPVRYDGEHKRDEVVIRALGDMVEWVPVCPESECGLPVPRERMHLQGDPASPRLVVTATREDQTERLLRWAQEKLDELAAEDIRGFVFKARSPSCGVRDANIFDAQDRVIFDCSAGLFARAFFDRFPHLPWEDESRLHNPDACQRFIRRLRSTARP